VDNEFRAKKHGIRRMFAFLSCTRTPISTKEKKPKKLNVTLTDHFSKYEFTRRIFSSRCSRIKSCPACIHENQRWNALWAGLVWIGYINIAFRPLLPSYSHHELTFSISPKRQDVPKHVPWIFPCFSKRKRSTLCIGHPPKTRYGLKKERSDPWFFLVSRLILKDNTRVIACFRNQKLPGFPP
jgi:hypothetical protein